MVMQVRGMTNQFVISTLKSLILWIILIYKIKDVKFSFHFLSVFMQMVFFRKENEINFEKMT